MGRTVMPVGKPDAGNQHVRFDERGRETERAPQSTATAPVLDSTNSRRTHKLRTSLVNPASAAPNVFSLAVAQAHPGAAPILVNEFDAGTFKRPAYRQIVGCGHRGLIFRALCAFDCGKPQSRFASEVFCTPSQKASSSPNLRTCERSRFSD